MSAITDNKLIPVPLALASLLSLLFCGAIFGFFYAWVCSTMWGLDTADPVVAIKAMQAMNASVRNAVFLPVFFFTPFVLFVTALFARSRGRRWSALAFAGSAMVYLVGAFLPTILVNAPMNGELAAIEILPGSKDASLIWQRFSRKWQYWNIVRTAACGISLVLTGYALLHLHDSKP